MSYFQSLRLAAFIGLIATTAMAQTPEANQKQPPHKTTAPAPTAPPPGHQGPPPGTPAPPHPAPGAQGSPPPQFRREEVGRPEPGRAEFGRAEPGRFEADRRPGEFRDGPHPHYGYYEYRERHFDRFSFEEQERWRGGIWRQEWHNGRYGWWWWNDGFWYYYPQPIYPYPDYVSDDYYRQPDEVIVVQPDYQPPVYQPAPAQPLPPAAPPPQQYWYYCDDPAGYSPYVTACNVQWRQVPVITPPQQ